MRFEPPQDQQINFKKTSYYRTFRTFLDKNRSFRKIG